MRMRVYLSVMFASLLVSMMLPVTTAAVFLPEYNETFASVPALFGNTLPSDIRVSAHLQTIVDWPELCEEDGRLQDPEDVVPPPIEGMPIALLVKRGECTFWEKGHVASGWEEVQYVIIYDQKPEPQLVAMSSELDLDMTLFFVSYNTGLGMLMLTLTLPALRGTEFQGYNTDQNSNFLLRRIAFLYRREFQ